MFRPTSCILLLMLSGATSGCMIEGVRGSGVRTQVRRDVPAFEELQVSNSVTADITIGDQLLVEVEGDDNLVPLIETQVQNGRLEISVSKSYSSTIGLKVLITTPQLKSANASNASRIVLRGKLPSIHLTAANAATIDAEQLQVSEAQVEAGNASRIIIHATERLSGQAGNASTVEYVGECKKVEVQAGNASTVKAK